MHRSAQCSLVLGGGGVARYRDSFAISLSLNQRIIAMFFNPTHCLCLSSALLLSQCLIFMHSQFMPHVRLWPTEAVRQCRPGSKKTWIQAGSDLQDETDVIGCQRAALLFPPPPPPLPSLETLRAHRLPSAC